MDTNHELPDGWAYSRLPENESSYTQVGTFAVDGETFIVRTSDTDGSYHYDWISGPNVGYGFSMSGGFEPAAQERHETAIRGFLSSIDPTTGYL